MQRHGYIPRGGQIVDASIVQASITQATTQERKTLKLPKVLQTAKVRLTQRNKTISRTRARVEHVFAALHQQGGKCVRAMSLARNALSITLVCVAYNARRLAWLGKSGSPPARAV